MKKIIYLLAIAFLAMNYSCSSEDLNPSQVEENSEDININELNAKPNSSQEKSTDTGFYDENGNLVDVYDLYLDMDYIEANYTGSYSGSFSQHFYNEMSAQFTIHTIEYASRGCENVERWVITRSEYDNFIISIGGSIGGIIVVHNDDGGGNSSTSSGNSNADTGWGDADGNVSTSPPTAPITHTIPQRQVPDEYQFCF